MKRTRDYASRDRRVLWHPFTQQKDWQKDPVAVIERGEGNYLIDTDGKRYLDGVSSLWANVHGHRVPAIDRAVRDQLGRIAHSTFLGLTHPPAIELAEKLLRWAPRSLSRVFYSDSGAASVEVALKMAYQYWQLKGKKGKRTFLKLSNAYHGDTLGSVSVGGIPLFHDIFGPLLFKAHEAPAPYAYRDRFRGSEAEYARHCADKAEAVLKKRHAEICALVLEPLMQGAAGMLKQPAGYVRAMSKLAKEYGVLLIADEVATGFGRTGKMFAVEHDGVEPDLMCVAKGITGGYLPLSATLATERIYEAFLGKHEDFKAFYHGHTYSANPLACAAAIASLEIFEKERTLAKLQPKVRLLAAELDRIARLGPVGDIRQAGFMAGIELVADRKTKKPYPAAQRMGMRVCWAAREKGAMLRPLGNVIVLMPPLSLTEKEIVTLCRAVGESIQEVCG